MLSIVIEIPSPHMIRTLIWRHLGQCRLENGLSLKIPVFESLICSKLVDLNVSWFFYHSELFSPTSLSPIFLKLESAYQPYFNLISMADRQLRIYSMNSLRIHNLLCDFESTGYCLFCLFIAPGKNYEYIHEWVYKSINIGILELEFSLA